MTTVGLGIDIGAESIRLARLEQRGGSIQLAAVSEHPHQKDPGRTLVQLLASSRRERVEVVGVTGRLRGVLRAPAVPEPAAVRRGLRLLRPQEGELTVVSIGAHGFSVLEVKGSGQDWYQQNSRCSQGTGNFLSQLVERFGLSVEEASLLCEQVDQPCALSGRCPVILKTDMTHLANKGEDKRRILAGLFDAVAENVFSLVRPGFAPRRALLVGGVARSRRIRSKAAAWLGARDMTLLPAQAKDEWLGAIGAGVYVLESGERLPAGWTVEDLLATSQRHGLERVPALRESLTHVHRLGRVVPIHHATPQRCVLGLDIGSTGSKAVAVDEDSGESVWESYLNTEGAPVQAAQRLLLRFSEQMSSTQVSSVGVTGSGREIVGSLLGICYGTQRVFVMNEIAAHARGAVFFDSEVDTIFEIGGQDAKYIRLDGGRVVEAAMNEACSAGTGSFIAEQGSKFGQESLDVMELSARALGADHGVSLGQHCSVFMAEVIDDAIASGEEPSAIMAGLYDSVIQNYLNRVKGPRSVGRRIFCQGMPFSSDALAAAVGRQTGRDVVVPPNPGTIGALGIALLTREEMVHRGAPSEDLSLSRFLEANVVGRETLICNSTRGCGGTGNHCRIDRLTTNVQGKQQRFLWGGNCSLYDRGLAKKKLPDRAPDPFREREALLDALLEPVATEPNGPVVAFPDEFGFKGLTPLFVVLLRELGCECRVKRHAGRDTLQRGIEGAGIPYCAPMQLIHGAYFDLAEGRPDWLLLPVFKGLPRVAGEEHGTLCPMVIGSADILASLLEPKGARLLRPTIDFDGDGYDRASVREQLQQMAESLGRADRFTVAWSKAVAAQQHFDAECLAIGQRALDFCKAHQVVPVAVLGRPYTIHNDLLNSNVPSLLRGLGALPVPVDCLPLDDLAPVYERQYWSHTQRNLRAAELVRRTPGLYSVFCSNYACGPDSFTLHFYAYTMQDKPYCVIETDGHSGDAGTKTRLEAFLFCVDADRRAGASQRVTPKDFARIDAVRGSWAEARARNDIVLLPRMGPPAAIAGAALRSEGIRAYALPVSTRDDLREGRRHTSGKECLPMALTLGTLLNQVKSAPPEQTFSFFMPTANGPCRFGVYNSLHKMVLEREGLGDRVRVISPSDSDYFDGMSADFSARLWMGFLAHDLLEAMRLWVRPVEREPGQAVRIYKRWFRELEACMEAARPGSALRTVHQVMGRMWGVRALMQRAAREFAQCMGPESEPIPTVAVVGEIYVRLDPFANDSLIEKLEQRGLRVHFAPFIEWLEYSNYVSEERLLVRKPFTQDNPLVTGVTGLVQRVTSRVLFDVCRPLMGWAERSRMTDILETGQRYVHRALAGEAVLTVGGPVHELSRGLVDGVVIVGPHECMPCKISEARYARIAEAMKLPHLVLAVSGEGVDLDALDRFAFELKEQLGPARQPAFSAVRSLGGAGASTYDEYAAHLMSAGE